MDESALPRGLGERLLALRSFPALAALPASELALVARLSRERDLRVGETLATEGEAVEAVQLLISGRATLSRAGTAIETAGALDTVGLLPIAAGTPHLLTAVATEATHALEIDANLVDDVLDDDFALFVRILRMGAASVCARRAGAPDGPGVLPGFRHGALSPLDTELPRELLGPWSAAGRLLLLRDTPLFRTAPVDGLAAFAKRLDLVHLAPGEQISTSGVTGELCVMVAGRAEVVFRPDAAASSAAAGTPAQAGDVLGGLEALAAHPGAVLIRAQTEVHLLRGAASDLLDVIEDHHAMGRRLMAEILRLDTSF